MATQHAARSGWKRLWIVGTVLWSIQAIGLAALIVLGLIGKWGNPAHPHLDAKNAAAMLGTAALYLLIPPAVAYWTARGIARMAAGKRWTGYADLSPAKKIWFVVACALYLVFFLPGMAGLAFYPTALAASAATAPMGATAATNAIMFAIAWLPQWALYTLGSWVLMRIADWVWRGFTPGEKP